MTDTNLVRKIQLLKEIRPRKDWVLLAKKEILGEEPNLREQFSTFLRVSFQYKKPVFATLVVLVVLMGSFGLAQNSLPGDPLYTLKKITEKGQAVFVSEENLPRHNLEIANKRLEELNKIAQTNQVKKLALAIEEYQASVSEAAKNLKKIKEPEKNPKILREVVFEAEKIVKNRQKVEALGVVVDNTEELENSTGQLIEKTIEIWEREPLNERQEEILKEAREYFEAGDYSQASQALEKVYLLSYPQK